MIALGKQMDQVSIRVEDERVHNIIGRPAAGPEGNASFGQSRRPTIPIMEREHAELLVCRITLSIWRRTCFSAYGGEPASVPQISSIFSTLVCLAYAYLFCSRPPSGLPITLIRFSSSFVSNIMLVNNVI